MRSYGIDLGTTNSAITVFENDELRVLKNKDQMDVTPSAVMVGKNGRILVGKKAYEARLSQPGNVAVHFKRIMGQSDRIPFDGVNEPWTPEALSAEVLKAMLDDAHRATGDTIAAAVVTVPADFSQLQCDAALRAARLAGLEQVILLQEPIAAAVAYGMRAEMQGKRWIVYDFGGGTFDAALVSTEDGRLAVLDHAGDNMCGGKDIDKDIVEKLLLPRLASAHHLPPLESDGARKLKRALYKAAEEAKIELSSSESAIAAIFEAGDDLDGDPIEFETEITRAELAKLVLPYADKTVALCRVLLERAGFAKEDVAGIILIGGPTNMPALRERLAAELGLPLEFSLDPMTVVSRGAAVYAWGMFAGQETGVDDGASEPGAVAVQLAYEPVCGDHEATVMGRIEDSRVHEVSLESESGHWSSGWRKLTGGAFEISVSLLPGRTATFLLRLRDANGKPLRCQGGMVTIRQGLAPDAPLLPHSIGAEVVMPDDVLSIDVLFPRGTPLPAERAVTYRARRTLYPGDTDDALAFKLWEGEYSDPESNTWLGQLKIQARDISRPIPQGAEIQIAVGIDVSRSMSVEIYVPVIEQLISGTVFNPEENQESAVRRASAFEDMGSRLLARIESLRVSARKAADTASTAKLSTLEGQLGELLSNVADAERDPDEAKRLLARFKTVRGEVAEIDKQIREQYGLKLARQAAEEAYRQAEPVVKTYGTPAEQAALAALQRQLEEWTAQGDVRNINATCEEIWDVWWAVVQRCGWYWQSRFSMLEQPGTEFTDTARARTLLAEGRTKQTQGDGLQLRPVVEALWRLRPSRSAFQDERLVTTGFRKR